MLTGETQIYLKKNLFQCYFIEHKSHTKRPEPTFDVRRPAINLLIHAWYL
jgi:hypothetical protein